MFAYQSQIAIKQERASEFGRRKLSCWKLGCHAQGPKRIPFYHFSPQITFFAVAGADCLLDREHSAARKGEKRPPGVAEIKKQKEPRLTGIYYSHTYGLAVNASKRQPSTDVIFFTHSRTAAGESHLLCYIYKNRLNTNAGRCGFRIMGVAPWEWMRLWICTQFYFNQSARKSAGRPINSASYFIRLTYIDAFFYSLDRVEQLRPNAFGFCWGTEPKISSWCPFQT